LGDELLETETGTTSRVNLGEVLDEGGSLDGNSQVEMIRERETFELMVSTIEEQECGVHDRDTGVVKAGNNEEWNHLKLGISVEEYSFQIIVNCQLNG
jgi:hypothetical protein